MVITKTQASEMAAKMLEKPYEAIHKKEEVLRLYVEKLYLSTIPDEVIEFNKKYSSYGLKRAGVSLKGVGLNYTHFSFESSLPSNNSGNTIIVSDGDAIYIVKCLDGILEAKKRVEKLEKDLIATILSFRTVKNIEKYFIKAVPFLPQEKPAGTVAINVSDVEARLDSILQTQNI